MAHPPFRAMTNEEIRDLLNHTDDSREAGDDFYNRFDYVQELFAGNYSAALYKGLHLLSVCQEVAPDKYRSMHKGTPYYWLGMAAFLLHDYQTAVYFFDAGALEDLERGAHPVTNPFPGLLFIQIRGDQPFQAARELVQVTEQRVERALTEYNGRPGRAPGLMILQLQEIRNSFLTPAITTKDNPLRPLATAFISYFLEWDYRSLLIRLGVREGTPEPFFSHLFKGCLLFESLLKHNRRRTPARRTLGSILRELSTELGVSAQINIGGIDFPQILNDLPGSDESKQTAVEYAGKVRNTVGHNLGWGIPLDGASYDKLAGRIASACLHALACLYR